MMKNSQKYYLTLICFVVIIFLYKTIYTDLNIYRLILTKKEVSKTYKPKQIRVNETKEDVVPKMKYILQWTSQYNAPLAYMSQGQQGFIEPKCPHVNCFVTSDKSLLGDYTKFDVIVFSGTDIRFYNNDRLPQKRMPHQKYVFATIESADNYPMCSNKLDGFFNWTWTYRLDSEVRWGYLAVRDKNNTLVGPNKAMHWVEITEMNPVSNEFKQRLKTKTKAAAWFVSNCHSRSRREVYVRELQKQLIKYSLTVDIYGDCGQLECSRKNEDISSEMLREKYYFYLSFENSFDEDYVTEKLTHALKHNTVPVIFGNANYTRFMPDGIYLNARELGPVNLAAKMNELINDPEQYAEYFKWKNHYTYYRSIDSVDTNEYCKMCDILNDEVKVKSISIYENFRKWWDPPNRC